MRYKSRAIAVCAYGLLTIVWLYVLIDSGRLEGRGAVLTWSLVGVMGAAHLIFGVGIGRWWALWLPVAAIFVAVPGGFPESGREPLPLWFQQAFFAPVEIALLAIGVGISRLVERRPIRAGRR